MFCLQREACEFDGFSYGRKTLFVASGHLWPGWLLWVLTLYVPAYQLPFWDQALVNKFRDVYTCRWCRKEGEVNLKIKCYEEEEKVIKKKEKQKC